MVKAAKYIPVILMCFQLLNFNILDGTFLKHVCLRLDFVGKKHEKMVQVQKKWTQNLKPL